MSIRREVNDRSGEASTLNSIGLVYHTDGQTRKGVGLL
ncbi:hypothetical protein CWATWH0402_2987 [Crocosphaera watsonii WH 0402]|uniref:Uncharacterized protein n=1 Tax=Crocosphaera watsonii WH 0402 TaxID=1284629 RepID=T2JYI5_CROWT|nr:hypothetical protein CWATWH0402_2987 [Crocosphaera watsonii WH 0402]